MKGHQSRCHPARDTHEVTSGLFAGPATATPTHVLVAVELSHRIREIRWWVHNRRAREQVDMEPVRRMHALAGPFLDGHQWHPAEHLLPPDQAPAELQHRRHPA